MCDIQKTNKILPSGKIVEQFIYFSGQKHQEVLKKMEKDEVAGRVFRAKAKKYLTIVPIAFFILTTTFFVFDFFFLTILFLFLAIMSTFLL